MKKVVMTIPIVILCHACRDFFLNPHPHEMAGNQEEVKQTYEASKKAGIELLTKGVSIKSTLEVILQPPVT